MQPKQPRNQQPNNTNSNQPENQPNHSNTGAKVALGSIALALIGLATIFIENGGLDFVRPLILGSNSTASQPTTQNNPSPIASDSPPGNLPSSPIASDSTSSGNLPSAPSSQSSPATQQPATSEAPTPQSNTVLMQSAGGFSIANTGCVRRGTGILCTLLITNQEADKELTLYGNSYYGKSRIIDSTGSEYFAENAQLGSDESKTYVDANFVQGIPLRGSLIFPDVPSEVNQLPLLELTFQSGDKFTVQFRDVAVSASQ